MDEKIDDSIDKDTGFKFNPIDETTTLPISRKVAQVGIEVSAPEALTGQDPSSGTAPYVFGGGEVEIKGEKEERPGFLSTAWHEAVSMSIPNTVWNIGSTIYKELTDHSEVPEGWNPLQQAGYYQSVPEKYHPALANASSPKRQEQIYQDIVQEIKDDLYYSKGPFTGKLLGGLAGFYGSGANFIKVAAYSRYSTMSETVLQNTRAALPGLTGQALSMAAVHQLGRVSTDSEEYAIEALQMLGVSGLLHGVGSTIKELRHAKKLDDAKSAIIGQNENISVEPVLNEKGVVIGYKAVPTNNGNLSAAESRRYNELLDEKINKSGLMKSKTMQKVFGNAAFGSTIVRMKSSRFATSAAYLSMIARNRFITTGEARGEASQITASEYHQEMQGNGYRLANRLNELYYKSIGLSEKGSYTNKIKAGRMAARDDERFISREESSKMIRDAIEGDKPSDIAEVNQAAQEIRDFMHKTNLALGKALGLKDVAFVTPKNYFDYFPHDFNHEAIKLDAAGPGMFIASIVAHLEQQDAKIVDLIAKRDAFHSEIQERQLELLEHLKSKMRDDEFFRDRKLTGDKTEHLEVKPDRAFKEETKALKYEIKALRDSIAEIEAERKAYWDDILKDPENMRLVVDGEFMTPEIRELGSQWFSELSKLESFVEALESSSTAEIKAARKAAKKAESSIYRQSTAEGRAKSQESFRENEYAADWIEGELNKALSDAKAKLNTERARLDKLAREGKMPRVLYNLNNKGQIEFVNPNRPPELKQHFDAPEERTIWAMQRQDRILGRTEDQIQKDLFGSKNAEHNEAVNSFKKRDRTIPYQVYNDAGFFSHDISRTITNYADAAGKRIGMLEAFRNNKYFKNNEDVASLLAQEYEKELAHAKEIKDPVKREKERKAVEKDYERARKDINGIHNAYMGNGGSKAANGFNKAFSMYASAAFMGGLPIALTTDIGQQIGRHGFGNYLATGLKYTLKTLNGHIKGMDSKSIIDSASDANVGLNVLRARVNLNQLNVTGEQMADMGNWFSRTMQFSGLASGQITFSNYITDMFHTMTTAMAQSRIMRNMIGHAKDGKISQKETQYMASLGIDMEKYSKRFVEQFKKYGRKEGKSEFYSEHIQWDDLESYDVMRRALHRDVMSTHFEGSQFDNPLWANNPYVKPILTFQQWAFAAFNNITVPLLQGIDGNKAMGIATMMFLGMLQEPMRSYINGKEYEIPDTKRLATIGILNSGILGHFSNMINIANTAMGGKLLPGFLPEKYRNVSATGAIFGVPGSIADAVTQISTDFYTGKVTLESIKKFQRLTPLANSWESRRAWIGIGEQFAESTGIPKNQRGSHGWGWWESLNENKD